MNMSYSSNPNLPKVRADAVKLVRSGKSVREVARHFGYSHSAVVKWCQKVHPENRQFRIISTESSRPHHHPHELDETVVARILALRDTTRRGAEFIHVLLARVVEADTVHVGRKDGSQLYLYTLIDVHSRWTYALPVQRISVAGGADFALTATTAASFRFSTVQTDHGSEFSAWFTKKLLEQQITHRYTRIRKPNDNAHIERFNRTIQDECIGHHWNRSVPLPSQQQKLERYLDYYNTERVHLGIQLRTPSEMLQRF